MKIRTIAPMLLVASGLVATTGCYHIHRDFHRWRNDRRYDRDRDGRRDYYRHDNGRHRGWDKD